jgi:hypothetical protein
MRILKNPRPLVFFAMFVCLWIAMVQRVQAQGTPGSVNTLHSFGGPPDGTYAAGDLAMDASGNLYGVTILAPATALRWLYEPETPVESSMSLEPRSYNAGTTWLGS